MPATASDRTAARVAILTGVVFVIAGLPKFVFFGWEADAFRRYGIPLVDAAVIFVGVVEIACGAALVARRWVVPSCVLLGITMVVAIWRGGLVKTDVIPALTLAPVLLVAVVWLLARELGPAGAARRRPA